MAATAVIVLPKGKMKKTIIGVAVTAVVFFGSIEAQADDEVVTSTTLETTTTIEQTTTTVEQTTSTVIETTTTAPPTTVVTTTTVMECPANECGYAVVDENNHVFGVIVCSNWCTGKTMTDSYMGCPAGCRLIVQTRQTPDGNVAGYAGSTYNQESNTFDVGGGYTLPAGNEPNDVIAPSTTTTVHLSIEPVETTVEETTTTTLGLVSSAVFGVERTTAKVSTKQVLNKRKKIVKKKPIATQRKK